MTIFVVLFATTRGEEHEVSCERVESFLWINGRFHFKTCDMKGSTVIDTINTKISANKDESVEGLTFSWNKKIFHLPIGVGEKFPNLVAYSGAHCSIEELRKKHFLKLSKLKIINFYSNQIKTIYSNTFESLTSLEIIYLGQQIVFLKLRNLVYFFIHSGDNKIKQINGELFNGLDNLILVWLNKNICIDQNFKNQSEIQDMPRIVSEKCEFNEKRVC